MDKKANQSESKREQILQSLLASFKIEGIEIPKKFAEETLRKLELTLGKSAQ